MSDGFYDTPEWLDLRYRVLQKSGGCCKLCGCRGSQDNPLHVDHIKPRSTHPKLALVESNLQVLCKACNLGESNKDDTDWRFRASREALDAINRRRYVLGHATPAQKAKLEQLSWLQKNDVDLSKEAARQYQALWKEIEADWISKGRPK